MIDNYYIIFTNPCWLIQHPSINKRAMGCLFPCTLHLTIKRNKKFVFLCVKKQTGEVSSFLLFKTETFDCQKYSIVKKMIDSRCEQSTVR